MIITTFDQDLFDLKPFAQRLQAFIEVEHQFVEGSLVIALNSKFGSGKTTFLQMWKADLEGRREEENTPLVISLNAWESDYYGDPLFAIVSGLIERVRQIGESADRILDAVKDIGWFATAIGGQIVQKLTGIDAVAAGEIAEEKKAKRKGAAQVPGDTFSAYQGRKDAMRNLKKAIREFVASAKPRVLFLVDELDRCRPDYAISYLETISIYSTFKEPCLSLLLIGANWKTRPRWRSAQSWISKSTTAGSFTVRLRFLRFPTQAIGS